MFYLGNTIERGYAAHTVLNRPYSRTHEAFKSLDITDPSDNSSPAVVIHNLLQGSTAALGRTIYTANTSISMLQTFDLGVDSIAHTLTQMAKLAAKAVTNVYSESELAVMQDQFDDLVDEVNESAEETSYKDYYLLNSDNNAVTIYIANGHTVTIESQDLTYTGATDLTAEVQQVIIALDEAQAAVTDYQAYLREEVDLMEQQIAMAESEIAQAMDYGMHIPNQAFARELAHEVMADISTDRLISLQTQARVNPSQVTLGNRNLRQPYIYQSAD